MNPFRIRYYLFIYLWVRGN